MKGIVQKFVLMRIFLRSFLLQAVWNFERMQNIGFLYSIKPILNRLYTDKEERRQAYARHMEFFNTHPYMASSIFGITVKEEELAKEGVSSFNFIYCLKSQLGGPLAAIGDSFFWATWKPLCALICSAIYLLCGEKPQGLWIPLIFLVTYNFPHLYIRWHGLFGGYLWKDRFIEMIKHVYSRGLIENLARLGCVLLGILTISLMFQSWEKPGNRLLFIGIFVLSAWLNHRGISSSKIFYGFCSLAVLISLLGWL